MYGRCCQVGELAPVCDSQRVVEDIKKRSTLTAAFGEPFHPQTLTAVLPHPLYPHPPTQTLAHPTLLATLMRNHWALLMVMSVALFIAMVSAKIVPRTTTFSCENVNWDAGVAICGGAHSGYDPRKKWWNTVVNGTSSSNILTIPAYGSGETES